MDKIEELMKGLIGEFRKADEEAKASALRGATLVETYIRQNANGAGLEEPMELAQVRELYVNKEVVKDVVSALRRSVTLSLVETLGLGMAVQWTQAQAACDALMFAELAVAAAYDLGMEAGKMEALKVEWRDSDIAASVLLGTVATPEPKEADGTDEADA